MESSGCGSDVVLVDMGSGLESGGSGFWFGVWWVWVLVGFSNHIWWVWVLVLCPVGLDSGVVSSGSGFWCGVQWDWILVWCPVGLCSGVESSGCGHTIQLCLNISSSWYTRIIEHFL